MEEPVSWGLSAYVQRILLVDTVNMINVSGEQKVEWIFFPRNSNKLTLKTCSFTSQAFFFSFFNIVPLIS